MNHAMEMNLINSHVSTKTLHTFLKPVVDDIICEQGWCHEPHQLTNANNHTIRQF